MIQLSIIYIVDHNIYNNYSTCTAQISPRKMRCILLVSALMDVNKLAFMLTLVVSSYRSVILTHLALSYYILHQLALSCRSVISLHIVLTVYHYVISQANPACSQTSV